MAKCRIIPIEYGDMACCILFTHAPSGAVIARIFNSESGAEVSSGSVLETPFEANCELESIRYVQSFDVLFFAQGGTYPCKLVRDKGTTGYSDGTYSWTFEQCEMLPEPVLDWNAKSDKTLSLSAQPDSELIASYSDGTEYYPKGVVRQSGGKFYQAIRDALTSVNLLDTNYYTPYAKKDAQLLLQIDGEASSDVVGVGSYIALRSTEAINESGELSYDAEYTFTSEDIQPPLVLEEKLPSKLDSTNSELRPETGGGVGFATEWFLARGDVTLKTEGLWSGVLKLQEMTDNGDVFDIATIVSENGNSNTELTREVSDFGSTIRVACVRREYAYQTNRSINGEGGVFEKILKADEGCQWTLTAASESVTYVKIVGTKTINGVSYYLVDCANAVSAAFETNSYALGAWSEKNGFPEHIAIYQERLVYACNKAKPTTLWLSGTNRWDDFEIGTKDSSAITATLATEKYDKIKWILPAKNGISIGTNYNEYSFGGADGGIATADNARATATSSIGSSDVRAEMFGTATIMVKTGGEELYRIDYNTLSEESAGNQISLLASHLFEGDPVIDMFSVKAPSNMLFCLHASGKLTSLTYEPEYGVTGWARHNILDGVVSGCVLRKDGRDVLCLVVKKSGEYLIGQIDLQSDVWKDDGESYESCMVSTPLVFGSSGGYGKPVNIAGCDIYVGAKTKQFNLQLFGGDWVRVDNGFDEQGALREFGTKRVEIPATSAWVDEAVVSIKSTSPYPLVLYAIGASVRS